MDKKRILVVDDEISITNVFKVIIERTGKYEVMTETMGSRAVDAAKAFKPHLILLDIMMPDLDGGEVVSQLKEDDDTREINVVFISAAITKEEVAESGGMYSGLPILAKPIHVTKLMEYIEKFTGSDTPSE